MITLDEISEHRDIFGIPASLEGIPVEVYKSLLGSEAFFFIDHHDCLRHQMSGDILAVNREQVDAMIQYLQKCWEKMPIE